MTLAALEATLQLYRNPDTLASQLPTLKLLTRGESDIQAQAARLREPLANALGDSFKVDVIAVSSQIGSGSFPMEVLPSAGLYLRPRHEEDEELPNLHPPVRELATPIIGTISNRKLLLPLK